MIPPSTSMGIKYLWKYLTSFNVVKEKLGSVDFKQLFGVTGNTAPKETSMKCHREWGKVVDELDKVAASMKQAADDGRKRMPKSFYEKLDRSTRRLFLVNDDANTGLVAALESTLGPEE
ncbi:hypothetical protein SeMB42_g01435 [Synchytrium endobioticum]|uniref:Uncharacterized protein n=1 Tax=Synchytrium endobioticum TaxID=286115 RepID=A0A507DL75_9FUNG|nr:hypothetical protein SeMB42_g01435 [Synchytrium endobioticum]